MLTAISVLGRTVYNITDSEDQIYLLNVSDEVHLVWHWHVRQECNFTVGPVIENCHLYITSQINPSLHQFIYGSLKYI